MAGRTVSLVCRVCGSRADLGDRPMVGVCSGPVDDTGYAVDSVEIVFHGVCAGCRAAPEQAPRARQRVRVRR